MTDAEKIKSQFQDGNCPDCGLPIPDGIVDGGDCLNCGHVFYVEVRSCDELELESGRDKTVSVARRSATQVQFDTLVAVEHAEKHFGSLISTAQCTRRQIMYRVAEGLVQSVGMVMVCDGDGGISEPGREREGFKLTDLGREWLANSRKRLGSTGYPI
jgi:hypothetical protein